MLEDYKRDHLFLLIGTNPLPNYVAARLLLNEGGHLYLVHSNGVNSIADNLIKKLGIENQKDRYSKVLVEESSAYNIKQQVEKYANGKKSLALHYTGGTKAMAVHAYRTLFSLDEDAVFSYLDARKLQMVIDRPCSNPSSFPIALSLELSIQELLSLHGYTLIHEPSAEPEHSDVAVLLRDINLSDFRKWCDQSLRDGKDGKFKKQKDLEQVQLPGGTTFESLSAHWQGMRTLGDLNLSWGRKPNEIEKTAKWLDGLWLEDYVLGAIQAVAEAGHIHQVCKSIEPKERSFEFDIVAMRGYQLFAISCTTDDRKSLLKSKYFEAFIRARQMGGDEARVALVCNAPSQKAPPGASLDMVNPPDKNCPEQIQKEIEEDWDVKGKVRVFGAEHLANLGEHLLNWFEMM